MSQAYTDNLKATGQCEDACIVGHDGTAWTPSGLAITPEEALAIIEHFNTGTPSVHEHRRIPGTDDYGYLVHDGHGGHTWRDESEGPPTGIAADAGGVRANGIVVAGKKFLYLRSDEEMMVGRAGQCGISIFMCGQCVIMGTYNQDMSPANNTKEVGKMADYLKEVGY